MIQSIRAPKLPVFFSFLVLCLGFLGGVKGLYTFMEDRIHQVKLVVLDELQKITGKKIQYGSISPNYLQAFEIKDLSFFDPDQSTPLLAIPNLKLSINFFSLITGDFENLIQEIKLENLSIDLDLDRDPKLFNFLKDLWEKTSQQTGRPWLNIESRNTHIRIKKDGQVYQSDGMTLRLEDQGVQGIFILKGIISGKKLSESWPIEEFETNLFITGRTNYTTKDSIFLIRTENFNTPSFVIKKLNLQIGQTKNGFVLQKIQDRTPLDLEIKTTENFSDWKFRITMEDLFPGDVIQFKGDFKAYNAWLKFPISGTAELSGNSDLSKLSYTFDGNFGFPLPAPLGLAKITASIHGDNQIINCPRILIQSPSGLIEFKGYITWNKWIPSGALTFQDFNPVEGLPLNGKIDFFQTPTGARFSSTNLTLNGYTFNGFDGSWNQGTWFDDISVASQLNEKENLEGPSKIQADFRLIRNNFSLDNFRLDVNFLPLNLFSKQLTGFFPTDPKPYYFNLQIQGNQKQNLWSIPDLYFSINHRTNPLRRLEGRFSYDLNQFTWQDLSLNWDYFIAQSRGSLKLNQNQWDFQSLVLADGLQYPFQGSFSEDFQRGKLEIPQTLKLEWEKERNLNFKGLIENFKLPSFAKGLEVDADFSGSWSSYDWNFSLDKFLVTAVGFEYLKDSELFLSGAFSPTQGQLHTITFKDENGTLSGQVNYQRPATTENTLIFQGDLQSQDKKESYRLSGQWGEDLSNFFLSFAGFPVSRIKNFPVVGELSGSCGGNIKDQDFQLEIATNFVGRTLNNDSLNLREKISFENGLIRLSDTNINLNQIQITGVAGTLDMNQGRMDVQFGTTFPLNNKKVTFKGLLEANLNQVVTLDQLQNLALERITGKFKITDFYKGSSPLEPLTFDFAKVKSVLTFRGGAKNQYQGRFSDNGEFKISVKSPLSLVFDAEGSISPQKISAEVTLDTLKLKDWSDFFNYPVVQVTDGTVKGKIFLEGPNNDPDVLGNLYLQDLHLQTGFLTAPVKGLTGPLELTGRSINLPTTEAFVDNNPIRVAATMDLDHWSVKSYGFNLEVLPEQPIPFSYKLTGIDAVGQIFGRLSILGQESQADLQGQITIQETKVMLSQSQGSDSSGSSMADFPLLANIKIKTGRGVEFIWPNETLVVGRAYVTPGQELTILVDRLKDKYDIQGTVQIRGGEINYFNNTFFLKEGRMIFKENESRFDPRIILTSEIRQFADGKPISIFLKVDDFLSRFTPRFESSPPMANDELMQMLSQAFSIPKEYTNESSLSSALSIASDVGTSFLLKPAIDTVKRTLNLDLFTVKTQFIKKAFLGNQNETPVSLADYLDNTTIFLGKYLGDSLFFEGLLNLKSLNPNSIQGNNGSNLMGQFEIGLELQMPWMLINWRFVPKSPDKLFIPDNTMSFSWRFTY